MAKTKTYGLDECKELVLDRIDIRAEFTELGVEVTGNGPNSKGWIEARVFGREDNDPSAGINVTPGECFGCYNEFGSAGIDRGLVDGAKKIWDFAVHVGRFSSFEEALNHYCEKVGIARKPTEYSKLCDFFSFEDAITLPVIAGIFAGHKEGYSKETVISTGARTASCGASGPRDFQQNVVVWSMYNDFSTVAKPCGFHYARIDGSDVRIPGKDKDGEWKDKFIKAASRGNCGIFNENGINKSGQYATVIWCEGLSDMLAVQEMVGIDNSKYAVFGMPGAKHCIPKDLVFWGDQVAHIVAYDGDEAGREGAQAIAATLVARKAKSVCIVDMEDGKDMRDWINEGHCLHDFVALADLAEELVPENEADRPTEAGVLLEQMHAEVLGEDIQTGAIIVYSRSLRKLTRIPNIDYLGYGKAGQAFGMDAVENHVYTKKGEDGYENKISLSKFRCSIVAACNGKVVDPDKKIGQGSWRINGQVIVVNGNEADILGDDGKFHEYPHAIIGEFIVGRGLNSDRWYDRDRVNGYLEQAKSVEWRKGVSEELIGYLVLWDNLKHKKIDAQIIAGFFMAAFVQSLLDARPHLAVIGCSHSGKTSLTEKFVNRLFGGMTEASSASSRSGIERAARGNSKFVAVDEIDKCKNQQDVLELFRVSTRGGVIIRGAEGGRVSKSVLNHMFMVTGVSVDFCEEADRNRFIVCELNKLEEDHPRGLVVESGETLSVLREKLFAIAITCVDECISRLGSLTGTGFPDHRLEELYAVPVSMLSVASGINAEDAKSFLVTALETQRAGVEEMREDMDLERNIIYEIAGYAIRLPHGNKCSVSRVVELMSRYRHDLITDSDGKPVDSSHIASYGVFHKKVQGQPVVFISPMRVAKQMFRGKEIGSGKIRIAFVNIPGYRGREIGQYGGDQMSGFTIPLSEWNKIVAPAAEYNDSFIDSDDDGIDQEDDI